MSSLTPCGGCKGPVGSVHTCPCGVSMHPFCGKGIGEEGYGQSIVCPSCQSAAPPPPATAAAVCPAAGAAGVVAGIVSAPPTPVTPAQGLSCDYAIYAYQLVCSGRPPPRVRIFFSGGGRAGGHGVMGYRSRRSVDGGGMGIYLPNGQGVCMTPSAGQSAYERVVCRYDIVDIFVPKIPTHQNTQIQPL